MNERPRLLIEDWLPAAAIGVECMRERGMASALAPHTYLHIWWARRPLTVSRAAVLGSLLPHDFPHHNFEQLLGFGLPGERLVNMRRIMDTGKRLGGFGCSRAFENNINDDLLSQAIKCMNEFWDNEIVVMDPMAGGGSIPFESARLGINTLASDYNPVACSILECTVDYPFRLGSKLVTPAKKWAKELRKRFITQVKQYFPEINSSDNRRPDGYIFARTVPCPETGFLSPLISDWHLLKKKGKTPTFALPIIDRKNGIWSTKITKLTRSSGKQTRVPNPTYKKGRGISLFTGTQIPPDYIQSAAKSGKMGSQLYAIVKRMARGVDFSSPEEHEISALQDAEKYVQKNIKLWQKNNLAPFEEIPKGDKTGDGSGVGTDLPRKRGENYWIDMFSHRQVICMVTLLNELNKLKPEIISNEGEEIGQAIVHLLSFGIDKFANFNCMLSSWASNTGRVRAKFDKHDYSFKSTWSELASCNDSAGAEWALSNVIKAYEMLCLLPKSSNATNAIVNLSSATNLPEIIDNSITAIIVDPPYSDNVQYSELADFFYVWLKRMQGYRRPEWFSTYLCEHDQEAVANLSRNRENNCNTKIAREKANSFYQNLMTEVFKECNRVLIDNGVLTVMFTHKRQEAWESLFSSLIISGFTITATWPIKTESEHSLHQAKKNAAQSTVILVARKRLPQAGVGYFDSKMKAEIRNAAQSAAERLQSQGLNPIDQLVGSFGPAIEIYSKYDDVITDTGHSIGVGSAIEEASDAVSKWRVEQLAKNGLEGVEPEGRFALLCWDVLGAAEFRFNEAKLLGHAVGMDVDELIAAGLVSKSSDKITILSAKERRRERALEPEEIEETLFGPITIPKRRTKKDILKIHPNDPGFRTALDSCHALALRFIETGNEKAGIGSAKALMRQQQWKNDSPVARLMEALVHAAPEAMKHEKGSTSAAAKFPEFRAWHSLLEPLFGIQPPDWAEPEPMEYELALDDNDIEEEHDEDEEGNEE